MLYLIIIIVLLVLGFVFGKIHENNSFNDIKTKESQLSDIITVTTKNIPSDISEFYVVASEAVISTDYFKTICASIKTLFGGKVYSFDSMMERARRTAIVRMKEKARNLGSTHIYNMRIETSSINSMRGNNSAAIVEVLAYGTALKFR